MPHMQPVASDAAQIRSAIVALLSSPRIPTPLQVWKALSSPERTRALWLVLSDSKSHRGAVGQIRRAVEKNLHIRRQTLAKKPINEVASDAARCDATALPVEAALREIHVRDRRPMLKTFLDALGVDHEEGLVEPQDLAIVAVTAEQIKAAVQLLAGRFAPNDIGTYLLSLLALEPGTWPAINAWRAFGISQLVEAPAVAPFPVTGLSGVVTSDFADRAIQVGNTTKQGNLNLPSGTLSETVTTETIDQTVAHARASFGNGVFVKHRLELQELRDQFVSLASELRMAADCLDEGVPPKPGCATSITRSSEDFQRIQQSIFANFEPPRISESSANDIPSLELVVKQEQARLELLERQSVLEPARTILRLSSIIVGPASIGDAIHAVKECASSLLAELENNTRASEISHALHDVCNGSHGLCALVTIIDDEDQLDVETIGDLSNTVASAFGEPLARAAMRGKLRFVTDQAEPIIAHVSPSPDSAKELAGDQFESELEVLSPVELVLSAQQEVVSTNSQIDTNESAPTIAAPAESEPPVHSANIVASELVEDTALEPLNGTDSYLSQTSPIVADTGEWRVGREAASRRHQRAAWHELAGSEPVLAYFHCLLSEEAAPELSQLPSRLVRAVCLSKYVGDAVSPVGDSVADDLATLDLDTILAVDDDQLQQALRLLVVAGSLRPTLLAPASSAATQLASLRHDSGFTKLWELCNKVVEFSRGGLALGPDVLSLVSSKAAWMERNIAVQSEARSWLQQKAPAYRFAFAGAAHVWRKMLDRGNLLDQIVRPVTENLVAEVGAVQARIDALSSVAEIQRQIQRVDREQVGRGRGGEILAGALRQLESGVSEALEIARRWTQLQRVDPAGNEGWRLEQAGKLRATAFSLRPEVVHELDLARDRARGKDGTNYIAAAVVRCSAAVDDLCRLFEEQHQVREVELLPDELLGLPLLLRATAPVLPDGKIDLSRRDALEEALDEQPSSNPRDQWIAAFNARLARSDFAGTQLLLDHALQLGCRLDERERDRFVEDRSGAIAARRHSVQYDVKQTARSIAQGAALGYVREQEHNHLLASIASMEIALPTSSTFAEMNLGLREINAKLKALRDGAVEEVRDRLSEGETPSAEMAQKVNSLLEQGDILTATEVLQNRSQWESARRSDPAETAQFEHFLKFLRRVPPLSSSSGGIDLADLPNLDDSHGPDSTDHISPEARLVWATWKDRKKNDVNTGLTKRLFSLLGFSVENVEQVGISGGPRWQEVTVGPVRDRTRCPVPFFGSRANGHYRVLWTWEPTSPRDIVGAVTEKDGSRDEAVIVFYFGRMDESKRRALRLESLQKRTRFLVLDDILLAYLVRLEGARMSAFFACALPFANLVPYHTLAGEVPPEMFYGRYNQRSAIQDRDGTSLVFGGRQLGKTALLKDVQGTFNNRAEGRIAIYADLKAAGVGVHRDPDAVWDVVLEELRRAHITIPEGTGSKNSDVTHDIVEKAVHSWISKSPRTNRVLLLLDEADLFFKKDGEASNFSNAHRFKVFMDRTKRAFKVVFAGLHNVQRSTRVENHPLAHLGVPVCVGPMVEGAEWQAAVDLVERPLAAMGYEIGRDLTIRILSHTNYYPSLIQIYCGELLKHVGNSLNRVATEKGRLPVHISPEHVEDAYRSVELRQRIKQSFDLTLNLDPRYRVIALSVAEATAAREPWVHSPRDIGVTDLRKAVMSVWGDGFRDDRSEDGFRALLEEMVGLGVLRRSVENRYALRGANVPLLLGSEEEVLEKLMSLDPPDTYDIFEPDTYRRPLPPLSQAGVRSVRRAPLTTRQEFDLNAAASGVSVICGTSAAGLTDVGQCLATGERVVVRPLNENADETQFSEQLQQAIRKGPKGTTLLVVPDTVSWNETWMHHAYDYVRAQKSAGRFVRTVFVAGPARAWALLRDHGGENNVLDSLRAMGVMVQSLQPWRAAVVRHWLEEQQVSTTNPAFVLNTVAERTGYWPSLLAEYVQAARGKAKSISEDPGPAFLKELITESNYLRWAAAFGLNVDEPVAALNSLQRIVDDLGSPTSVDELIQFAELDERLANRAVAWADTLGLGEWHSRKYGPAAWALNPAAKQVLRSCEAASATDQSTSNGVAS